jgi:ABC-type phosphate/phosphonate transport system ATPase subunit
LKDNVSPVSTDVLNVLKKLPIVLLVPPTESTNQNVSAQKVSMTTDIMLNVNHVIQDVELAETTTFVTNVMTGDLMNLTFVLVPLDSMTVLQKEIAVNVTTDV